MGAGRKYCYSLPAKLNCRRAGSVGPCGACRRVAKKPLITKLSPNQTDSRENARLCIEAGSDELAVINTISDMTVDLKTRRPVIGNVRGGIASASDALEFLIAGATTGGVRTALFYDPLLCLKINADIADSLLEYRFASVNELTGTLDMLSR